MTVYMKLKHHSPELSLAHSVNFAVAAEGFHRLGAEIKAYYSLDEIYDVVTIDDIVLDYIDQCNQIFAKFGVHPRIDDYPACLKPFLGRKVWHDTINSIACDESKWSAGYFVKPVKDKRFTGRTVSCISDLIGCGDFSEDYEVICSEPVQFMREWRGFIYYDQLIDLRPYRGDIHYQYDPFVIDQMMEAFRTWDDRPNAMSMDIGVTKDGHTLLIECNDCYATGCYGLDAGKYARFISARWAQLLNRPDEYHFD